MDGGGINVISYDICKGGGGLQQWWLADIGDISPTFVFKDEEYMLWEGEIMIGQEG